MLTDSEIIDMGKAVLECEAASINAAISRLGGEFPKAVRTIMEHKGKLLVCGVGKSGLVGQKIAATLSSTGTPAVFLHACDAVHGDLGVYEPGDPTVLISNSGATVECLRLMPILKKFNSPIIALVGNMDSPMARDADVVLDVSSSGEADPLGIVPTNSTTLALAVGDALACALMKARGFSKEDFAKFHPAGQLGRNLLLTVRDVMTKFSDCAVAKPENTVREVVMEMTRKPLGAACILEGGSRRLVGLITDGDIRRMLQKVDNLNSATCADIMTVSPITVDGDASLGRAVELMEKRKSKLSVLPVVDSGGNCEGLVRLHDIYQPL